MFKLDDVVGVDLRAALPRAVWEIGRQAHKRFVTLHFNGPAVAGAGDVAAERAQLVADARWQMRPGGLGAASGGDGLQYHFAILSDGAICQTRDLDAVLWHCANAIGNRESVAVHIPRGEGQDATDLQWSAFGRLCDRLIADFSMAGRQVVLGHREWPKYDDQGNRVPNSVCPGPILFRRLQLWRGTLPAPRVYRVIGDVVNTREGPGITYPVALRGTAQLRRGATFVADSIATGGAVEGNPGWAHRADGIGFISLRWLEVAA